MKNKILFILKILILIIVLILPVNRLSLFVSVLGKTSDDPDKTAALFYYLPKDTVDVLIMGNSHAFCSFINKNIYDDTGIASATISTSAASPTNEYWELKEALKTQRNIKLVILETSSFEGQALQNIQNSKLHFTSGISILPDVSLNKMLNFVDIKNHPYGISDTIGFEDVLGIVEFSGDTEKDTYRNFDEIRYLITEPARLYKTFGFSPQVLVHEIDEITTYKFNKEYVDFTKTYAYEYLEKIYELCKENNIEILLARSLYNSDRDLLFMNEQIDSWAKEHGVPLIDYFSLIDECEFDLKTDFRDEDHLNYWGAKKATKYLISYLEENYDFVDHRGDSNYVLWEEADFDYAKVDEEIEENIRKKS